MEVMTLHGSLMTSHGAAAEDSIRLPKIVITVGYLLLKSNLIMTLMLDLITHALHAKRGKASI
jgi:hypothetical protein